MMKYVNHINKFDNTNKKIKCNYYSIFHKKKSGRKKVIFKKNKGRIRVLNGSINIDFINDFYDICIF